MASVDLTDNVSTYLVTLLENNRPTIENQFTLHGFTGEEVKGIYKGQKNVIPSYPAIEILPQDTAQEWFATRLRQETYRYNIDCSIKSLKSEEAREFVRIFGRTVQNILNSFENLQFAVPGTNITAFDSWADNVTYGVRNEGAIKTARVSWMCKILVSYIEP